MKMVPSGIIVSLGSGRSADKSAPSRSVNDCGGMKTGGSSMSGNGCPSRNQNGVPIDPPVLHPTNALKPKNLYHLQSLATGPSDQLSMPPFGSLRISVAAPVLSLKVWSRATVVCPIKMIVANHRYLDSFASPSARSFPS